MRFITTIFDEKSDFILGCITFLLLVVLGFIFLCLSTRY